MVNKDILRNCMQISESNSMHNVSIPLNACPKICIQRIASQHIWIRNRMVLVKQMYTRVCVYVCLILFRLDECLQLWLCSLMIIWRYTLFLTVLFVFWLRDGVARSKTLTRNVSSKWPQNARDHIIQSSSCTSFEYKIQLHIARFVDLCFFSTAFQLPKQHLNNHISLVRVSINYISKSTVIS